MKPDWNDAPDWANYLAMDGDGQWYWYQKKPVATNREWVGSGGNVIKCQRPCVNFKESLEERA